MRFTSLRDSIRASATLLCIGALLFGSSTVGAQAAQVLPYPDISNKDASVTHEHRGSASYELLDTRGGLLTMGSVTSPVGPGRCTLDTGPVYKRTSGGVGGHPKTTCTMGVSSINHSTTIYKHVWWGLQRVGGPFNAVNYGQSKLEQKTAAVACADDRNTTFRMVTRGTVTYAGRTYIASAYDEATLACGTSQ